MDPEAFSASLFKWDPRGPTANRLLEAAAAPPPPHPAAMISYSAARPHQRDLGGLEDLFHAYGIRYYTAAKISELGFTVSTLIDMKDEELDDMMNSLSHLFRYELLVGERYGIKAAVRAELRRRHLIYSSEQNPISINSLDALSQEGLSEEKEAAGSAGVGSAGWEMTAVAGAGGGGGKEGLRRRRRRKGGNCCDEERGSEGEGGGDERQREHPFIVTEPGEVARGKKNGLDYLFHLYEQCREFLVQVQNIAKERGEKCPTKVTNQVFRYAKKAGASYINKPKMRHYVHCYALHCLDEEASNALRRVFKERGENVGAWRQACYRPLVNVAGRSSREWDIDAVFNSHPRLSVWYVPTKLRQLCHAERSSSSSSLSAPPPPSTSLTGVGGGGTAIMPF
ncbi:floricaula/leafy homolog 2 [Impatiens glandulifera]|uniref:floricaula/leafy homolog 2 n=1 Tax=Impatiens glandulifera TaxID=253017 RepID=UPI001FB15A61|nr:floricaula/leafy homolog 2 [Impatiens glandulifera]